VARPEQSVWRQAAVALDEEPDGRWRAFARHHGSRGLLLLLTAFAIYLLFPAPRLPDGVVFERGVVATQDVIAEIPFDILKSFDELTREQRDAANGVPPVYVLDSSAADSVVADVDRLFLALDSIVDRTEGDARRTAIRAFLDANRITPTPVSVELIADSARRATLHRSIAGAVRSYYPLGVVSALLSASVSTIRVELPSGTERYVARDSLLTPDRFRGLAAERYADAPDIAELQQLILIRFFQPSLVYDGARTEAVRDRARAAVDPVVARVLKGERIVGAHEQIGEVQEERLRAYQTALVASGSGLTLQDRWFSLAVGGILFNALILGILGGLIYFFRQRIYRDWRSLVLIVTLVLVVSVAAAIGARLGLPVETIPVTFAAVIIAALWDARLGLATSMVLAILIGSQTPFIGVTATFMAAVGGAAASFGVRVVQRRTRTWHFIALVSAAYTLAVITMGLLRGTPVREVGGLVGWSLANVVVASLLALGFLPLCELFTRLTTDQTLLELSDLNRKLLNRLSLEAPGTYAHTVAVANIAEAAANAIDANGLLTRVGTYYHDIGKLTKPQYFIENQPRGRNPHDKLKPGTSASIIRNHVAEGLKLAESDRLPEAIRNFIAEHHGTQQISYFYNKALELDPDGQINAADFTYPGPRPRSRETAIVMLADTVESAARVLQDATPARLREMVDRLVAQKLLEGQLSQSPLTLKELDQIKEAFNTVLSGMYHQRIDYPSAPATGSAIKAAGSEEGTAVGEAPVVPAPEALAAGIEAKVHVPHR
jgi:putative nucleotidyltransferase with HDIG domain